MIKNKNYSYLLRLYSKVNSYLAEGGNDEENFPEIIVYFCVVAEKILKIKLHRKHPILVFNSAKITADDALVRAVEKDKANDLETAKIDNIICRYKLIFKKDFSESQLQTLLDIYKFRNHLVHAYKSDEHIINDEKDIIKKMSSVWPNISKQALGMFGENSIKISEPKIKYTEKELKEMIKDEVAKKIQPKDLYFNTSSFNRRSYAGLTSNGCPRCGAVGFSDGSLLKNSFSLTLSSPLRNYFEQPDLYTCNECHLELTETEYKIAKEIVQDKWFKDSGVSVNNY